MNYLQIEDPLKNEDYLQREGLASNLDRIKPEGGAAVAGRSTHRILRPINSNYFSLN